MGGGGGKMFIAKGYYKKQVVFTLWFSQKNDGGEKEREKMKNKKLKLLLSLCSFVFCVVALCFGVYAATTATLTISGTITFEASTMYLNSVTLNNLTGEESSKTLYENRYLNEGSDTELELELGSQSVDTAQGLEIDIKLTSLEPDIYKKVIVSYTKLSGIDVQSTSTILQPNEDRLINSTYSSTLKIFITSENTTSLDLSFLNLTIGFEDYGTSLLKQDTTEGYYYVEMGTLPKVISGSNYKNEYVRWRYISADGETKIGDTQPSDLKGWYILETYNALLLTSWENSFIYESGATPSYHHTEDELLSVASNDYRASNIRQYLNLTGEEQVYKSYSGNSSAGFYGSGTSSNLCTDLNIDPQNDIVYKQIRSRSIADLYTDISANNNTPSSPSDITPNTASVKTPSGEIIPDSGFDKFWLLSHYEAYTLLSSGTTISSDSGREWDSNYWLRSPNSGSSNRAFYVCSSGDLDYTYIVYDYDNACRAAFQIL